MTDIYEYKANKYKLKYLKLKSTYFAEGGTVSFGDSSVSQQANSTGPPSPPPRTYGTRTVFKGDSSVSQQANSTYGTDIGTGTGTSTGTSTGTGTGLAPIPPPRTGLPPPLGTDSTYGTGTGLAPPLPPRINPPPLRTNDINGTNGIDDDLNCVANSLIQENDFKKLDIELIYSKPIYYNEIVIPFDKKKKDYYQREYYRHYYNNKYNADTDINKIKHICRKYEGLLLKNKKTNYEIIKYYDSLNYNTPEIIFIGKINYIYKNISNFKIIFNKTFGQYKKIGQYITNYNIITKYFDNCSKFLEEESTTYKYIIREKSGTNIFENIKQGSDEDNIDEYNIKVILLSLKTGIDILITGLYNDNYILNNINKKNMILKKEFILVTYEYFIGHRYQGDGYPNYYLDYKVYFTDYTKLTKCNDNNRNNDIKALGEFIAWLFSNFKFEKIEAIDNILLLVTKLYEDTQSNIINNPEKLSLRLDAIIKLINIDIRIKSKRFEYFTYNDNNNLKEISSSSIKIEKF